MFIARRVAAGLLFFIAFVVLVAAGIVKTVDVLAGSPSQAAGTVSSIMATEGGSQAAARFFVHQIEKDADAPVRAAIDEHRDALVSAAAVALRNQATRDLVQAAVVTSLTAVEKNRSATVDMRPIFLRITGALHAVDPRIPAAPKFGGAHFDIKRGKKTPLGMLSDAGMFSWLLTLLGLGLALVAARLFFKGFFKQIVAFGVAVAVPTLMLLVGGNLLPTPNANDANAQAMIQQFKDKIGGSLAGSSLWLILFGLLMAGGWWGILRWRAQRAAATPA